METYAIIHLSLWWIFNICAIFWKVQFPFHSRYYDQSNRTRYVHIACVVAAIILPVYAPLAIALNGGFAITRFPPTGCLGRDVDAIFYTVIYSSNYSNSLNWNNLVAFDTPENKTGKKLKVEVVHQIHLV